MAPGSGPMAGAAMMVWAPRRTVTRLRGLSARTSLLIGAPVLTWSWRALTRLRKRR
jgi:hypothetical protein